MGNVFTSTKATAPLLQPAIAGEIDQIKALVGQHIASTSLKSKEALASYVNQTDKDGNTAIIGAAFSGHLEIVKFLLEDCHADIDLKNNIGCSALWIAAGYGHVHILEYLIQRVMNGEESSLDLVKVFSEGNSSGDTPLLAAVSKGHVKVVEIILSSMQDDAWAILTCTNKTGDTPLSVAVGAGYEGPLLNLLIDCEEKFGNDKEESRPLHSKNAMGLTPLLVASERNFTNVAKELISRGADISMTDEKGRTPLAIASFCGCMDVMEYLLSNDDVKKLLDARDASGCTPLWLAARTGNLKMVRCLVDAGADASLENNDGLSPEAAAVKYQKKAVIDFFQ